MIESLKNFLKKIIPKSGVDSSPKPDCRIINGSFQVSQCAVDEKLKINGIAILGQNTVIKKPITVNGQLEAIGTLLENEVVANGSTDISNSSLKQKAHFSGNLTARDCQFSGSIILLVYDASFIHCQIDHIIIQGLPYVKTRQIIRLSNNCEITGNITFDGDNGEVWIERSSKIHGKVDGGKIIFLTSVN